MKYEVSESLAVRLSPRCEFWAVASERDPEETFFVVIFPDSQAYCFSRRGSHNRPWGDCTHIRRVRVERGEPPVLHSPASTGWVEGVLKPSFEGGDRESDDSSTAVRRTGSSNGAARR